MFELIKEKLNALGCEGWELTENRLERWEFYQIGHRLDQNRAVTLTETEVKVYVKSDDGQFLGNAADKISPSASGDEIERTLKKLVYQASLVKNPYYTLASTPVSVEKSEPADPGKIAEAALRALASVPEDGGRRINSSEIFVTINNKHFCNSNGVECEFSYPSTEIEVVINAKKDGHEIELYRDYESGTCDGEKLRADISRVMDYGADRLIAKPTPKLERFDVLLSTSDACDVYDYFSDKMHADFIFRKFSDWKIGEPVCADVRGDRITLRVVPQLPNSPSNYPVDREGSEVYERYLIRDGIAENYCGSRQFSQYLGLDRSSLVTNLAVDGGSASEAELRSGDYLEIVEFSDFQVDPMSGDIAGEIRLGYLHRGGSVAVVTGGSVSGSMTEAAKDLRFSRELTQYGDMLIPSVTLLKGLRITGVE